MHQIGAFGAVLHDHITGAVHHIGVIASPAHQAVVADPAVQRVIAVATVKAVGAGVPVDNVGERIARAVDVSAARQRQSLRNCGHGHALPAARTVRQALVYGRTVVTPPRSLQ